MNISDLAKKLNTTQKMIRDTAKSLSFDIKAPTKTVTPKEAKEIEKALSKPIEPAKKEKIKKEEGKKIPVAETIKEIKPKKKDEALIEPSLDPLLPIENPEEITTTDVIIEEIERDIDREIIKEQRKQKLASGKIHEKKTEEIKHIEDTTPVKKSSHVQIPGVISVKELSEKVNIPINKVIAELFKNGLIVTLNHKIDFDTACIICDTFGIHLEKQQEAFSTADLQLGNLEKLLENEDKNKMEERAPIVTIMGHVDHGKTKLLDYIRKTNVIATEAGGITQKIGAYQVVYKEKKITFLDTPGHEAFTAMRARGAKVTDIAILVVAADEGVKPQTREAYDHVKDANIPIIVAINKMDKPGANMEAVKVQLSEIGLIPEEWGGSNIMTPVSALTGKGVEELLEMILLVADMNPLKANPNRPAIGTVIESNLDPKFGAIATILINTGTLNMMDNIVVGEAYGRIKVMFDHTQQKIKSAGPCTPVLIVGLSEVPSVGDILQVEKTFDDAKRKATEIKMLRATNKLRSGMGSGMSDIIAKIHSGQLKTLKIVLKADSKGSLEAIRASIDKIQSNEVEAKVIHSNVGNITETDVLMAAASGGIVMGFNVEKSTQVEKAAERENVEVRSYRVIYQLLDEIKKILLGLLDPEIREISLGELEVLAVFLSDRKGMIIGGRVTKGKAVPKSKVRIIRKDKLVGEGDLATVRRDKDNVSEAKEGYDCGLRIDTSAIIETGDIIEVYTTQKVKKESL